jgi:hypothetical protein
LFIRLGVPIYKVTLLNYKVIKYLSIRFRVLVYKVRGLPIYKVILFNYKVIGI